VQTADRRWVGQAVDAMLGISAKKSEGGTESRKTGGKSTIGD
jgi:hypothetical protein